VQFQPFFKPKSFQSMTKTTYFEAFRCIVKSDPSFTPAIIERIDFVSTCSRFSSAQISFPENTILPSFLSQLCNYSFPPSLIKVFVSGTERVISVRGLRERLIGLLNGIDHDFLLLGLDGIVAYHQCFATVRIRAVSD
jgi:hypothetical protein